MSSANTWREHMPNIERAAASLEEEAEGHDKDSALKSEALQLSEELRDILQNLEQLKRRSQSPPPTPVDRARKAAAEAGKAAKRANEAAERAEEASQRARRARTPVERAQAARQARAEADVAGKEEQRARDAVEEAEGDSK